MIQGSISYKVTKGAIITTGGVVGSVLYFLLLTLFPYTETVVWGMPTSIFIGVALNILGLEILERTCSPSSSNTAKKNS